MKKREIDIFGILLGVVIGCILGFFLSSRINLVDKSGEEPVIAEKGNVHLLQIAKLDNPAEALTVMTDLNAKGFKAVTINKGNDIYYIFAGIALSADELSTLNSEFLEAGYQPRIVKEYLLDKPNAVIENEEDYEFWTECINNLLNSLEEKSVEVSEKYLLNRKHPELLFIISSLNEDYDDKMMSGLQLDAYKLIIETL
ncbi:MAG: SPOR domain-containing protein, partial [Bacilli bacterium]|nr:SPOR domain-containing protein [Bacilli bacterium]